MKASAAVLGERHPWQVGAVFESEDEARRAADAVASEAGFEPDRISVLTPEDIGRLASRAETGGDTPRTLARPLVVFAAVGTVAGVLVALGLLAAGMDTVEGRPGYTIVLLMVVGLAFGLVLGGLLGQRPDRDALRARLEKELADGHHWAVVVRAQDREEESRAGRMLETQQGRVITAP